MHRHPETLEIPKSTLEILRVSPQGVLFREGIRDFHLGYDDLKARIANLVAQGLHPEQEYLALAEINPQRRTGERWPLSA